MGDIGRCELIYGELVMMSPAGAEHGFVAGRIFRFLAEFVEQHQLGAAFAAETGFRIESNPDLVRAPDASFVRKDRLLAGFPKGYVDGVPDLAVEVISPGDTRRAVSEKTNLWLAHGTRSVWVADPSQQTIAVHRVGQQPAVLRFGDTLKDELLLPGFALSIGRIFQRI